MPTDNYAIDTAIRLNEIGFAEFTSDLIGKTFDALIDANLRQTESYIELVKEMTKTLSVYINETKLEISNQEVLDFLGAMPTFVNDQGQPIVNQAVTGSSQPPAALAEGEQIVGSDLNALNKNFTNGQLVASIVQAAGNPAITSLVKDGMGLIRSMFPQIPNSLFPIPQQPDYYDPGVFQSLLADNNALATQNVSINDAAIGKLYDSVSEVIAGNKYALLQEMVKLGVLRIVATNGVVRSSLTFSTYERSSKNTSTYEKHQEKVKDKYKQKQAPSRGILVLIRNRPLEKTKKAQRDIHVKTMSEQTASSQGTTVSIFGGVEIHFKTDYLPVSQA